MYLFLFMKVSCFFSQLECKSMKKMKNKRAMTKLIIVHGSVYLTFL